MTKIQSAVFGLELVSTVAIVLLCAFALISAEASAPTGAKMEAGTISPIAMHLNADVSKLPVQDWNAF